MVTKAIGLARSNGSVKKKSYYLHQCSEPSSEDGGAKSPDPIFWLGLGQYHNQNNYKNIFSNVQFVEKFRKGCQGGINVALCNPSFPLHRTFGPGGNSPWLTFESSFSPSVQPTNSSIVLIQRSLEEVIDG